MKKFYKLVTHQKAGDGYHILLDGRSVKTPSKTELFVPTEKLAVEIVKEWAGQGDKIIPDTMPLTQILTTKQDRVALERPSMQEAVLKYLDTDLLCYLADMPEELVSMQEERWKKWREWFEQRFGVTLQVTNGLAALKQEEKAHKSARDFVEKTTLDEFTVLQLVTASSGSLILALAFCEGAAQPSDVINAAFAEEDFQGRVYGADKYGDDPLLAKKRTSLTRDIEACRLYLSSL